MGRTKYHVTYNEGKWQGKKVGADRASVVGETKSEVVERMRQIAKNQQESSLVIHKKNNVIQEERTYGGKDPYPPQG